MQLQREELCERVLGIAMVALTVAGFVYAALGGMNIAILPAAFIEAQATGSTILAACSFVMAVLFFAASAVLFLARANGAYMGRFCVGAAGVAGVALLTSVALPAAGVESVLGNGFFMFCNVIFGLVLVAAAVSGAILEPERVRHTARRAKHLSGSTAKHVAGAVADGASALPLGKHAKRTEATDAEDDLSAGGCAEDGRDEGPVEGLSGEEGGRLAGLSADVARSGVSVRMRANARRAREQRMRTVRRVRR